MIQGTASDVGKSLICTALCRILKQEGHRVAPFKSQNMALNSYVTIDGKEIGRSQGVQAEAAGVIATVHMNPVLLKPKADMTAQVVVRGTSIGDMSALDYRRDYIPKALEIVAESLSILRQEYDVIILEGAGSPAEINLKDRDISNMKTAALADAPVLLIADIDRGGVFASLVGTLELLEPDERNRVKGLIINKFRGDICLLQSGLDWLEEKTGIPVLGVIPYQKTLFIENEDSVVLEQRRRDAAKSLESAREEVKGPDLDIAVILFPYLSNFTDLDPLAMEPDARVRYVQHPGELGNPDALILPGTKNTVSDLGWLWRTGIAAEIVKLAGLGKPVLGICGGYQMLGKTLFDPMRVESDRERSEGLGLLDCETAFVSEKRTLQAEGTVLPLSGWSTDLSGIPLKGYEIHMGRTSTGMDAPFCLLTTQEGQTKDGSVNHTGKIIGTYLHGLLHSDKWRRTWLNQLRLDKGLPAQPEGISISSIREMELDRWAGVVREAIDVNRVLQIIGI